MLGLGGCRPDNRLDHASRCGEATAICPSEIARWVLRTQAKSQLSVEETEANRTSFRVLSRGGSRRLALDSRPLCDWRLADPAADDSAANALVTDVLLAVLSELTIAGGQVGRWAGGQVGVGAKRPNNDEPRFAKRP